jgi:hypothetical protein
VVDGQYRTTVEGPLYTGQWNQAKQSVTVSKLDWPDGSYGIKDIGYNGPYDAVMIEHPANKSSVSFWVASRESLGAYESNPPVYYDAADFVGASDSFAQVTMSAVMT